MLKYLGLEKSFLLSVSQLSGPPFQCFQIPSFIGSGCKRRRCLLLSTRVLRIYLEPLMEFNHIHSPDGFNNTLLSQAFILENAFHYGNSEQSVYSKDRGEGKEPPIAWSSPGGQLVVTFSPRLPPTITYCQLKWDNVRKVLSSDSSTECACNEWKV